MDAKTGRQAIRIASLQPSISLTLAALGRLDTLCAVTKYCITALPELAARGLPVLTDSWSFDRPGNVEALLTAKPDLVIASVPYRMESLAAILKCGIPVLALAPRNLADIYKDIRLIGAHVDADAELVIGTMQRAIDDVGARCASIPQEGRPLVYCEEWGKPLIHSQTWVAEMVEAAGGRFLGPPGAQTDAEAVAAAEPDVLLFAWCGAGDRVPLARVVEQRGWQELRAVRKRRVYVVPDELLNTPGPELMEGLKCIAAALHPEIFAHEPRLVALQ